MHHIARQLRLEIEPALGLALARAGGAPDACVALGLQAIGLLLQLEGVDQQLRALEGETIANHDRAIPIR